MTYTWEHNQALTEAHKYAASVKKVTYTDEVSDKFALTKQDRRVFCQRYGISLKSLMHTSVMEHSRELLRTTDKLIKQIAYEVGYSGQHSFTDVYKKHFGVYPGEDRAK